MSATLSVKGYVYPGGADSCGGCESRASASVAPFELSLRNRAEMYASCSSGEGLINTPAPTVFVPLPGSESFDSIEFLVLKTTAPVLVRLGGAAAYAVTACAWPVLALPDTTLSFVIDGYALTVDFALGDDTPIEAARRINAAAALAGLPFIPAHVVGGQVQILGAEAGAQGSLSVFTGDAAPLLGLAGFGGAVGKGAVVELDGLGLWQFKRGAGVARVEISGQASVSVLAAGI